MSTNLETTPRTEDENVGLDHDPAELAARAEAEANAEPVSYTYTHVFKRPFDWQGVTVDQLTFDWGALTGADHLEIENELLMRGKTLVMPEFTGEFLCGMAVRACTERDSNGVRFLSADAMKHLPMRDFQKICKRARAFLLRAES